ncbi:hypothetical protein ABH924_003744 [Arthrobacter sp. GAS37]|uniref:hypothetical protein n=1 Tax=Arthrobacter sp. GAS37 TaxID=3156261 RepID=UPI003834A29C
MTGQDPDPLKRGIEGLEWMIAQMDAMGAGRAGAADSRASRFAREVFAALPVTADPDGPRRCVFCRRLLAKRKRKDAVYCSARCRDRAYRRRLHKAALNLVDLEWVLTLRAQGVVSSCLGCGRQFMPEMYRVRRSDRRYCSGKCRTRAWRARKASAETVTSLTSVTSSPDA